MVEFVKLLATFTFQAIQWRLCKSFGCNNCEMQSKDKFVTNYQSIDQRNKQNKPNRAQPNRTEARLRGGETAKEVWTAL